MTRTLPKDRPSVGASHEVVDHTSEITLRFQAPGFSALLDEATRAFGRLVPRGTWTAETSDPREFHIPARDRAAALVGWLNEMVYLGEIEEWLPVRVEDAALGGTTLRVRARGVRLARPFVLVKAATLHRARVDEGPRGFSGEVTLDV